MSAVPFEARDKLGHNLIVGTKRVRGIHGGIVLQETITANLIIGAWVVQDVELVVLHQPYFIVGRDILNRYRVILDGPTESWSA